MARIAARIQQCTDGSAVVRIVVSEKDCLHLISRSSKLVVLQLLDAVWDKGGVARVAASRCLMAIHARVDLCDDFRESKKDISYMFCGLMTLTFLTDVNRLKDAMEIPVEDAPRKRPRLDQSIGDSPEHVLKCQPGKRTCDACWWKCETEGMACTDAVSAALNLPLISSSIDEVTVAGCMQLLQGRPAISLSSSRGWVGDKQARVLVVLLVFLLQRGQLNPLYLKQAVILLQLVREVVLFQGRQAASVLVPAGIVPVLQKCAEKVNCMELVLLALGTLDCLSPYAAPAALQLAYERFMDLLTRNYVLPGLPIGPKVHSLSSVYFLYHCRPQGFPGLVLPKFTEDLACFWESCLTRVPESVFHVVIFQHISNWAKLRALTPSSKAMEIVGRTFVRFLEVVALKPAAAPRQCLFWQVKTLVDCTSLIPVISALAHWDGLSSLLLGNWASQTCSEHRSSVLQGMFTVLAFVARINVFSYQHIMPVLPLLISELKRPGISGDFQFSCLQLLFMVSASHKHFRVLTTIPLVQAAMDVLRSADKASDVTLRMAAWLLQRISQWPVRGEVSVRHVVKSLGGNAIFGRMLFRLAFHSNVDIVLSAHIMLDKFFPDNDFMLGPYASEVCLAALTPFQDPKMECAVCLGAGNAPLVFLPCLHYFCVACIKSAFCNPDKCVCPICRDPVLASINRGEPSL